MKAKGVILGVLCATALVGMTIWLAAEHQARLRLGEENTALRQQLDRMASLVAENERLSNFLAQAKSPRTLPDDRLKELLRLRGEVGVLREQAQELETLREENRQARTALASGHQTSNAAATANYWPRGSWAFAGFASPEAALQSSLWAASKGDLKTFLGGTTGEMQKMVEKDFEGKSESEAADRAVAETTKFKSVSVLNSEAQSDDGVVLTVAFEEGADTHTTKLFMQKVGNDWKLSGPPPK